MKLGELELSELPTRAKFIEIMDSKNYLLESYTPTTIEADMPFMEDWWKYIYWIPRMKEEFYLMALSSFHLSDGIFEICNKYGMDLYYFTYNYSDFVTRLKWMRAQSATHIGEIK